MSEVVLIFPHQLFRNHPAMQADRKIYLVEEWLYFSQYNFHQQKLILHRASMKYYESYLQALQYQVEYIDCSDPESDITKLIAFLAKQRISHLHLADVADNWLSKRIRNACNMHNIQITIYPTPAFLNTPQEVSGYFDKKKTYFQTDFYTHQRKQRKLLLEADGKPTGGKWTFDAENRLKYPRNETPPKISFAKPDSFLLDARKYVQKHFSGNYGNAEPPHYFVTNFDDAESWLQNFLRNRFNKFGDYEDAIIADELVLHHSVLTPMLNTGLLTPQQILDAAFSYADENQIPINSLEGFTRQIVGWREFIRIVYEREGSKQRTKNFWQFKRKIPSSFWTGTTGIEPIDITIKKVLKTGYCHHIERLMVLGNFMLLCEFDPDEVYRWFMEMFIDAYDWVMVPNVYGMTQFADGGLMTTKPYISGSNYLMKMSNYEKGEWQQVWDGLFWRFMDVHRDFFLQNPRLGMLIRTFDKMSQDKKDLHHSNAESFLQAL